MKPVQTRIRQFHGLRSGIDKERMTVGDLVSALNVRIDETGRASRRPGHALVNGSARAHSVWTGSVTLAVIGDDICLVNADYSVVPIVLGAGYGPTNYVEVEGRIYWSNGSQTGCIEAGVNRSWGLPVPVPLIGQTAGLLPAGVYQAAATWRRNDGQESGASAAFVLDLPADGGVSLAAPTTDDPTIEACVLYVSPAGSTTLYRAGECAPGGSLVYDGSIGLVTPLLTQFLDRAPPSSCMAHGYGRMWLGVANMVLPSQPFAPELFDLRQDLPFDSNVTMIAPQQQSDGIFVGTETGLVYLEGADPEQMKQTPKNTEAVLRGSLVYVKGALFGSGELSENDIPVWAQGNGIYAGMPDGSVKALTLKRHALNLKGPSAMYFDHSLKQVVLSAH